MAGELRIKSGTKLRMALDVPIGQEPEFNLVCTFIKSLDAATFLISIPMQGGQPLALNDQQKLLICYGPQTDAMIVAGYADDVDSIDGGHNGQNYMAYTYYVRNAGKEDVVYRASITLDSCSKGAEEAVRVAVWRNGQRTVYAMPSANGEPEEGCVNFESEQTVCTFTEEHFLVGNVDKYTIVIWMEGEDPECVDKIVGGSVEFSMHIDSDDDNRDSLLVKFVKDIVDTLTGNKPISAASNDAPDYYTGGDVNWHNRCNQGEPEP